VTRSGHENFVELTHLRARASPGPRNIERNNSAETISIEVALPVVT
jgi:hypothetical protein